MLSLFDLFYTLSVVACIFYYITVTDMMRQVKKNRLGEPVSEVINWKVIGEKYLSLHGEDNEEESKEEESQGHGHEGQGHGLGREKSHNIKGREKRSESRTSNRRLSRRMSVRRTSHVNTD